MSGQKIADQLEVWRRDLIDFSRRNRLLNLNSRASTIELIQPTASEIIQILVTGKPMRIHPETPQEVDNTADDLDSDGKLQDSDEFIIDATTVLKPNEVRVTPAIRPKLKTKIRTLKRRSDQEFLDKGIRILYLAVGTLNWFEDNEAWSSPILLFPVELQRVPEGVYDFRLNPEEEIVLNPALIEKLREDLGIDLPVTLDEDNPLEALAQMAVAISGQRNWSIDETVNISVFSFAKEVIFRDLKTNAEAIGQSDLVSALAFGADSGIRLGFDRVPEENLDLYFPPTKLNSILDADATQRQAVIAAKSGRSFVIDGPPGTGKSQTIANIIAELIGDGKSVLFVSEKAAALEVVQRRLEEAGLGTFLLPLHSQKVTRKEFAGLLMKSVTERAKAGAPLSLTQLTRLETNQKTLSAYVAAMNEVREPLGKSLYTAIGEHARLAKIPSAPVPSTSVSVGLTPARYLEIEDFAGQLSRCWAQIEDPMRFIWRDLTDASASLQQRSLLLTALANAKDGLKAMVEFATKAGDESGIPEPETVGQLTALASLGSKMTNRPLVPITWLTSDDFASLQASVRTSLARISRIQELRTFGVNLCPTWLAIEVKECNEVRELAGSTAVLAKLDDSVLQTMDVFESFIEELGESVRDLESGIAMAKDLAPLFGEEKKLSIERTRLIASVARLARSASLPEGSWFSEEIYDKVMDAVKELQPVLSDYWERVRRVDQYFTAEVRSFPIENLFEDGSIHPNLGIMSSQGRRNRKALAKLSRSGRLGEREIDQLSTVKDLVRIERTLAIATELTGALGTYYRGVSTDLGAVGAALEVIRDARAVMKRATPESMAMVLARDAPSIEWTVRASKQLDQLLRSLDTLTKKFRDESITEKTPIVELLENLRHLHAQWTRVAQIFDSSFGTPQLSIRALVSLAEERIEYSNLLDEVAKWEVEDTKLLGALYHGDQTDAAATFEALDWTIAVRASLSIPPSASLAKRILEEGIELDEKFPVKSNVFHSALGGIRHHFLSRRWEELHQDLLGDIDSATVFLDRMIDGISQIDETVGFETAVTYFRDQGLSEVINFATTASISQVEVVPVVMKAVIAAWIEAVLVSDAKRLSPLDKKGRDDAVLDFSEIDRLLKHHAASRIAEVGNNRRPVAVIGAVGVIQKEAQKKAKHMRIIDLLTRTEEVALAIKPCFMMSPLSVSSFLPASMRFDAVIFDEASQMLTSNAVNAVYRGRQLIVAGDEKQLPPTSFWDRGLDEDDSDEYLEDGLDNFESVLHQAKSGGYEQVGLRWHYRSRHESLITYSNYSFYNGELVTYPSAIEYSPDLGVSFVHVPNGVYKRSGSRSNTIEAQKVVERVLFFADHHPQLSVGVVAFSTAQADEIENQLEAALESRPDIREYFTSDRLHGFFVKNLESVQGDERDVIIFSVGYGKDEHGKLTMNFGPVNREGGWRRLNVAFTRARRRIELVSSISAGDFEDTINPNVKHLKRYFDYAERGVAALAIEINSQGGGPESPFEEEVIQTINSWGYDVESQVGQAGFRIDMAIRDPKRPGAFILGIECDGAAYHSSKVARDRDRLRQEVLEGLGWSLYRIWGPTWYRSRKGAEADLKKAIEEALSNSLDSSHDLKIESVPNIRNEIFEVEFADISQFIQPYYKGERPPSPQLMVDTYGNITNSAVSDFILEVVTQEGPVSMAIVKRRFAISAGMWLRANVQRALDENIRSLLESKRLVTLKHSCLALPQQDRFVARKPDPLDELTKRDAKNVALTEIAAAVANFVGIAKAIDLAELEQLIVKSVFGWDRVTQAWKDSILEAVALFESKGWWTYDTNVVRIGPNFPS